MQLADFLACIDAGNIPPEAPDGLTAGGWDWDGLLEDVNRYGDYLRARAFCVECGMWAVVDQIWTDELARWIGGRRVLELMAGRGWLAKALAERGVPVTATDDGSWQHLQAAADPLCDVRRCDAVAAVRTFGSAADVLLVSWPPRGDVAICQAAAVWGPDRPLIYVGEGRGGRNAPDRFFDAFQVLEGVTFSLKSWHSFHDSVQVGYYQKV
jgi:hypothetical protein